MAWNLVEGFKDVRTSRAVERAAARGGEKAAAEALVHAEKPFLYKVGHKAGSFSPWGAVKGGAKKGSRAVIGVAALGGLAAWAISSRNRAKRESNEALEAESFRQEMEPLTPPMPQQPMMQQPDPAMMAAGQQQPMQGQPGAMMPPAMPEQAGPADGRAPNEWQQRVAAERGAEMGQPAGPNQPAQGVVPESNVQDLGAANTDGAPTQPAR